MDARARAGLADALALAWAPFDRRPIFEWAAENISLPADYGIEGPFHVEKSRYLIEPFLAVHNDAVRMVTIQAAVQTGKSLIGDLSIAHAICNAPRNLHWNFPTDEQAKNYADRRAMKLFRHCSATRRRLEDAAKRDRFKVRAVEILFHDMTLVVQGANEGNLQSHSVPFIINEELWQWNPGMYQQACARADFFSWRKKILNISQAGEKGCDLDLEYQAGTMEEWEVPCPECRQYQPLVLNQATEQRDKSGKIEWAGLVWETNDQTRPQGKWNFDQLKPSVRYRCAKCLAHWEDTPSLRRQLNDYGRFRVLNANASIEHRSFHWNAMACDEISWAGLAEKYLRAKDQERVGNRVPIREFHLKQLAETFDAEKHLSYALAPAATVPIDDGKLPHWPLQEFIFLTVDVQRGHFWALVQAWNSAGLDMAMWAGRLTTWEDVADKQKEWSVPDHCVFVDARYEPQQVYRECTRHGHEQIDGHGVQWLCWTAMMGDARREFKNRDPNDKTNQKRLGQPFSFPPTKCDPCIGLHTSDPDVVSLAGKRCRLFLFAKGTIDPLSFDRRELMLQGMTSLVAPGDWNKEYSRHMQGEQVEETRSKLGVVTRKIRRTGPNHLLDCYRMGLAAACIARILSP